MANAQSKRRIPELDIARAIAVVSIIIYHTGLTFSAEMFPKSGFPPQIVPVLDTYHLYVLFIVSGYLTDFDRPLTARGVLKSARGLLLPYLVACLLIIAGAAISAALQGFDPAEQALRWTQAALWGAGSDHEFALAHVTRIGGIWYLPALFWAKLFIGLIARLSPRKKAVAVVLMFAVSYVSGLFIWLPMSIQSGLGAVAYMYIGSLIRRFRKTLDRYVVPVLAASAALWIPALMLGGNSSLAMCAYPAGPIDIIGGIGAAVCILYISRFIADHLHTAARLLELVGRNTLALFTLHIVEDNVAPWLIMIDILRQSFGDTPVTWLVLVGFRLMLNAALVGIAYLLPPTRAVFFPHVRGASVRRACGRFLHALDEQSAPGAPVATIGAKRPTGAHFRS